MIKQQWILCPVCGNKTRTMIQEDTEMRTFLSIVRSPRKKQLSMFMI